MCPVIQGFEYTVLNSETSRLLIHIFKRISNKKQHSKCSSVFTTVWLLGYDFMTGPTMFSHGQQPIITRRASLSGVGKHEVYFLTKMATAWIKQIIQTRIKHDFKSASDTINALKWNVVKPWDKMLSKGDFLLRRLWQSSPSGRVPVQNGVQQVNYLRLVNLRVTWICIWKELK